MPSASFLDGLALAATLKGDRGQAAKAGLTPGLGSALEARVQEIRAAGRERTLAGIAAALRPAIEASALLPARAAAVLAPEVPRATGAAWMARAPLPRPGFRASPALRGSLRRLASAAPDEGARERDREAGRAMLRDETSALVRLARSAGLDGDALAEALGAMQRGAQGDGSRARWVRAGREVSALSEELAWRG